MTSRVGNVNRQQKKMRGWLVGQFFPKNSPFCDNNVEFYCKSFKKGDKSDRPHLHPVGREYFLVTKGLIKMQIGEEEFEVKEGEYSFTPSNTLEHMEVLEDSTIVGVRYPSIPNNKVILEE